MPPTRASKRQRVDTGVEDTPKALTQVPATSLARRLMIDLAGLEEEESEDEEVPKVAYKQVAPRVGLDPYKGLTDIETFEIHRSRIPTNLFKSIVTDMDMMLMQYGPPFEHKTDEARSRFFSPIFNRLSTLFNFMLRNYPETMTDESDGSNGTQGHIQYLFKNPATVALVIEKRLKVGNEEECLEAIARVITEIDSCDLDNKSHGYSLPIYCVFSYDWSFEFFRFERKPDPSFTCGSFPGPLKHSYRGLHLSDFKFMETPLPFILKLRSICETIFDMMLRAYVEGLKASYDRFVQDKGKYWNSKWSSLDGWDQAIQSAECALAAFRRAEDQRKDGDIESADETVDQALLALQESTGAVPTIYKCGLIMKGWDDTEVRKA